VLDASKRDLCFRQDDEEGWVCDTGIRQLRKGKLPTNPADAEYCRGLLRHHDPDRYVASLFASNGSRHGLWGVYAFGFEIARIRGLVSGPAPGEVRLQWWRDAIDGLYAGVAVDHPVARVLAPHCTAKKLPKQAFMDLIDARRLDLYGDPMSSLVDLDRYFEGTSSSLIRLAAMILDPGGADGAAAAARFGGLAYGLVGILRSLPFHRATGRCLIPVDVLERYGLDPQHVLSGGKDPRLAEVLTEMRSLALRRLGEARNLKDQIPPAAMPAFLPLALIEAYAAKLARAGTAALETATDLSHVGRLLRLWRAAKSRSF
jgi:phytoene synthase